MLNLGCGRVILPGAKPYHHMLVDDAVYAYPEWVNIDKNGAPGVDMCMDLFRYPWDLEDNAYSGALLSHICEHIPHRIDTYVEISSVYNQRKVDRALELSDMQDGWFAFFSELWRVLEDGAIVHVLVPYGRSEGALADPSHTRYLVEDSFRHSMTPDPDAPFDYKRTMHFEIDDVMPFVITPDYAVPPWFVDEMPTDAFWRAKRTQFNVISEFYVRMKVVKSS